MTSMEVEEPTPEVVEPRSDAQDWAAARLALTRIASGLWGGLLSGFVIGGLGGRLAMFVLRLTSDPSLHGMETDDEFIIGRFSPDTFFLVIFTAVLGLLGGIFYMVVRGWFPERARPVAMGIIGAAVGGALVVNPGGIDFTLLEPLPLAIAMFVVIPAGYGVATSLLTERFLRSAEARSKRGWIIVVLPLLPILALGPLGILVLLASFGVWAAGMVLSRSFPSLVGSWTSAPVAWPGRVAIAALTVYAGIELIKDSVEIL